MASGNHVCNPIWADFPVAAIKKKKQANVIAFISMLKKLIEYLAKDGANTKTVA
jgi:hemerythrin superfamily protein